MEQNLFRVHPRFVFKPALPGLQVSVIAAPDEAAAREKLARALERWSRRTGKPAPSASGITLVSSHPPGG